jgi:hypothetical protein
VSQTDITESETDTTTVTGGRLYAVDKDGATWLDISSAYTNVENSSRTASLMLSGAGMSLNDEAVNADRDDTATEGHAELRYLVVWWGDLRSRSITYSVNDDLRVESRTTTVTASGGPTGDGTGYADPDTRTATGNSSGGSLNKITGSIVFYGEEIRALVSEPAPLDLTPVVTVDTTLFTLRPFHLLNGGYSTTESSGAVLLDGQVQEDGMPLELWQQATSEPRIDQAINPLDIASEPTSSADPAYPRYDTRFGAWIAYRGTWAYSMPDIDREDPRSLLYTDGIKHGDLALLTGDRVGVELYEQMWPLSLCVLPV